LGTAVLAASHALSASAQSVTEFYKGNRVTILIGSGVGGGYDTYARLVARHIARLIPGNPTIISQNMPAAASVAATNHMVNVLPKDGTIIGALQREIAMVQILGQPGPKFKATELNWLGSLTSEPGVCAVATRTGIKSFGEVFTREVIAGSTGPNALEQYPSLFNKLLGAKIKIVRGYKSSVDVGLAIERNELNAVCQSWASFQKNHAKAIKDGAIAPVVQVALKPNADMTKLGVPMFSDFVTKDRTQPGYTVDDVMDFFNIQLSTTVLGRPYAMAPGVPADRLAAIRKAFLGLVEDDAFMADAKKLKRDIDMVTGDEISAIVRRVAAVPKEKMKKLDDILK
jgi:tripartite-type tricarboxylate transporter receptor subunit TctC